MSNHRTPTSCHDQHKQHAGDDHHHHHHDHGDGGACDHTHDVENAVEETLFPFIDTTKLMCYNEHETGAGKRVFKPWNERLSDDYVESSVDSELLFHIPFTVAVHVKSICVIGSQQHGPSHMKVFRNKGADMGIDDAESATADQSFDHMVACDYQGDFVEYQVKPFKFKNVQSLTLYFPSNLSEDDDEPTRIHYIGIKGEATSFKRQIVETMYEARPQLSDHKNRADEWVPKQLQ